MSARRVQPTDGQQRGKCNMEVVETTRVLEAQQDVAAAADVERLEAELAAMIELERHPPQPTRPVARPGVALHSIVYSDAVSQHLAGMKRVNSKTAHPDLE